MRKSVATIVLIAIVLIGTSAFFLLHKSSSPTTQSTTSSSVKSSVNSAATATKSVTIENFAFSPASITVKKGTTVSWTNKDSTGHTVTQDDGSPAGSPGLDSKVLNQGESYRATFSSVGTFKYRCSMHPSMTALVTVTE